MLSPPPLLLPLTITVNYHFFLYIYIFCYYMAADCSLHWLFCLCWTSLQCCCCCLPVLLAVIAPICWLLYKHFLFVQSAVAVIDCLLLSDSCSHCLSPVVVPASLDISVSYQLVVAFAAVVFTVTVHCTGTLAKATDVSTTCTVTSTLVSLAVAGCHHELLPPADCCFWFIVPESVLYSPASRSVWYCCLREST